jgi:hypothetical protein
MIRKKTVGMAVDDVLNDRLTYTAGKVGIK